MRVFAQMAHRESGIRNRKQGTLVTCPTFPGIGEQYLESTIIGEYRDRA